jgi:hypothetical protein
MRRRDVGRGRRLRPRVTRPSGSGGREPIRPLPAYLGEGRLIRPPRTTTGPPRRLEADREKAGRVRPERAESSILAGFRTLRPGRRQERRLEAYRTPNVPERSGRGPQGKPLGRSGESPSEPRGRRKAPIKIG